MQLAAKRKEAARERAERERQEDREKERAERERQEERQKRKARLDAGFTEVSFLSKHHD